MSECAHPQRCGSDGVACGWPDCPWSPENVSKRLELQLLIDQARAAGEGDT